MSDEYKCVDCGTSVYTNIFDINGMPRCPTCYNDKENVVVSHNCNNCNFVISKDLDECGKQDIFNIFNSQFGINSNSILCCECSLPLFPIDNSKSNRVHHHDDLVSGLYHKKCLKQLNREESKH